ncbi:MAG: prephenate dehydrogenase/arogenate dehydrogenase family protein [Candidatus Paceibacterota bacterium]|jgi:prephenate dehydrogenase
MTTSKKNKNKPRLAIVGFGRFGQTLHRLLKDDFAITVYDPNYRQSAKNLADVYNCPVIFYAVPISAFESVIALHRQYFKDQLLIDVLSVKLHPEKVFKKYLKGTKARAILTHPMFGPDSSKDGFAGLRLVMDRFSATAKEYVGWKKYFSTKKLEIIEMSAKEHDRLAASSQGLTHFIGRLLNDMDFKESKIDTLGAKKLHEVVRQTCNDTWELFLNLQNYNPYTKKVRLELGEAYDHLYNKLIPKRIHTHKIVFGIQGGIGSFNEEALLDYVARHEIKNYEIKYLYTTEKVMRQLHEGNIDYGQFAIHNSVGGVVQESTYALAKYKVKIVEEFAILIRHFLMRRGDADPKKIKTIMAHPQVFAQCQSTLAEKYKGWDLQSGKGDLVDTARAAQALSLGKLPKQTAILGPANLAKLYNLEVVAKDLQDNKQNLTSFFMVSR